MKIISFYGDVSLSLVCLITWIIQNAGARGFAHPEPIGVTPLRTEVHALLQFHRKLLATTKAQLVRWRTKKTR